MLDILKRNLASVFIAIGVIICLVVVIANKDDPTLSPVLVTTNSDSNIEETAIEIQSPLLVDIKGEVKWPGVYEMEENSRIKDVVEMAGGFTDEADETSVNLAQKVFDEMVIIVPATSVLGEGNSPNFIGSKIRINYATAEEIEKLPGIGPSKAKAIIEYREKNGFFKSVEELLNVSGIGEKTLELMVDEIQIP